MKKPSSSPGPWFLSLTGKRISRSVLLLSCFICNWASASTEVMATVRVRTNTGDLIARAYVALVPAWRPSSRPLVEEIAQTGVSALRVPAGMYWVIAGAKGFAVSSRGPVTVSRTSGPITIELPALKPVSGTTRDSEGKAVASARVASVNAAIPAPLGTLSELAVRHLASDWWTTTDERGNWTLKLPEGAVPLLFEAPGRAAEWRIRPPNSPTFDVYLSEGATLKVTTDRVDPNLILTLAREEPDATPNTSIPVDEQPRVWARWTKSSVLTWNSLPPGMYGVYAKYPEPRYFMQTAAKLTTVTVAPGEQRTLRVTLPPLRRAATNSGGLFLRDISRKVLGEGLEVFGRDTAGNPQRAEHLIEEVIGGSVVYVKTDVARGPIHGTTNTSFFFTVPDLAQARQEANAEPWPVSVRARADARLSLRFVEKDLQPPRSGMAVLRDCGQGDRVTVPIAVGRDNVARFTAGAGCRSVVLQFEPYEPVVTATVLRAGDQSLGDFTLRGAGSAEVRVVRDPSGAPAARAIVRAMSRGMDGQLSMVVTESLADGGGWARLTGLPPRRDLRVIAETTEGDKSDSAVVRVEPRERALVDPLVVPEPAALIVAAEIDAAFLTRFPEARLATLFVRPADLYRQSEQRQEDAMTTAAVTRFDRLHPGRWLVSAAVSVAGTYSLNEIENVELKAGETRRLEATIAPNVFEGIVTSEGKGVAAKVIIEDRGRRLYFSSDAGGVFRTALQSSGTYRVAVARLSAQGNIIPIGDVAFTDPSRRVEIAIPAGGSVTARVRLGDQPLPRTTVWVSRRDNSGVVEGMTNRGRTTDLAGIARFDDLASGVWTLSARANEQRRSTEKTITVEAGKNITTDLELAEAAAIKGTIRDLGGSPLAGAQVECLFVGASGNPDRASVQSDGEGMFAIDLSPPSPPSAFCGVIGSLGRADAFKAIPGQPVEFTMPGATAALQIPDWGDRGDAAVYWLVAADGRVISLNTVALTIGVFGSPLTISGLAAGRWKVVRVESLPQWLALATGMGVSLPAVAEVTLRAGSMETIRLR